jgi:hypothetical protein
MPRRNVCWGTDRYKTRAAFTGIIRSLPPVMMDLRKPVYSKMLLFRNGMIPTVLSGYSASLSHFDAW